MTTQSYLRRRPADRVPRSRVLRRIAVTLFMVLAFAVVDTTGNVKVTQLTKSICDGREDIRELRGELGCLASKQGFTEARGIVLDRLARNEGFVTPDSGRVVQLRASRVDRPLTNEEEIARAGIW